MQCVWLFETCPPIWTLNYVLSFVHFERKKFHKSKCLHNITSTLQLTSNDMGVFCGCVGLVVEIILGRFSLSRALCSRDRSVLVRAGFFCCPAALAFSFWRFRKFFARSALVSFGIFFQYCNGQLSLKIRFFSMLYLTRLQVRLQLFPWDPSSL